MTSPPNDDDYIGNESCIDLQNDDVVDHPQFPNDVVPPPTSTTTTKKSSTKEKRVFPPPIPLLARTQNLASHMPWVLRRYYTSEGRLILREEKVRHHEYFRAHRANGRLTLQLVPLDDDDDDDDDDYFLGNSNSEVDIESPPTSPHKGIDKVTSTVPIDQISVIDSEEKMGSSVVGDGLLPHVESENGNGNMVGGANGRVKCLNCNDRVRSAASSCIFGVRVHPVRTVRG